MVSKFEFVGVLIFRRDVIVSVVGVVMSVVNGVIFVKCMLMFFVVVGKLEKV